MCSCQLLGHRRLQGYNTGSRFELMGEGIQNMPLLSAKYFTPGRIRGFQILTRELQAKSIKYPCKTAFVEL